MNLSLLLKAFTGNIAVFWASTVIAGVALGAYYALDLALVMRTVNAGAEGGYLGVFNLAKTVPQSIGPAVAPQVLMIGGPDPVSGDAQNYGTLYVVGAGAVFASLAALLGLRATLRPRPSSSGVGGGTSDAFVEPIHGGRERANVVDPIGEGEPLVADTLVERE